MNLSWDNPVARHAGRLASGRGWPWAVLLLLVGASALGALLQRYWLELPVYSFVRPQMAVRWLGLTLLAETAVALPWAAVRGAALWRRLVRDGHLDEYRRSRLSPASIALGAISAALHPVLVMLVLSLAVSLGLSLLSAELEPGPILAAHLLLIAQSAAFAALGLWLAGMVRYPAIAVPIAVGILAAAVGAIWALEPFYRTLGDPAGWIFWALLPNPVTAVGNALGTDVLRFSWIYQQVHAHEYFFVYPAAWQTGSLYLALSAALFGLVARRVRNEE
jgi:hypothetical protein